MKKSVIISALTIAGLSAGAALAGTMDDVKARGKLNCGVTTGLVGLHRLTQMVNGKALTLAYVALLLQPFLVIHLQLSSYLLQVKLVLRL